MAENIAVCGAQAPLPCQFCDTNNDVKWKCFDCSLLLCDSCKIKLHSRLSFEKVHKIINISNNEFEKETKKLDKFHTILCHFHEQRSCCLFCKSCDELICPSCILETHKDHILEETEKASERKRSTLEKFQGRIDDELLVTIQEERKAVDELWSKKQRQYENTKHNIESQTESIIKCVTTFSTTLLDQLETFNKRLYESIEIERTRLDQNEQNLIDKRNNIEKVMFSNNPADVFIQSATFDETLDLTKPPAAAFRSMVDFVAGRIEDDHVHRMLGSLLEIRAFKSYITDLPDVGIVGACNEYLWIANKDRKVLRKIKPGDSLQTVTNIENIEVSDFAVTPSGELILKLSKSNKLKILSSTGKQRLFRDFSPWKPTCVHATTSGDIVVGVKDIGPNFVVSDNSRRQLVVLTAGGKQKYAYEYDRSNKQLFTYIWHMTSTNSGEICVIDRLSDDFKGRIIMLGPDGRSTWVFSGDSNITAKEDAFKPRDVVAASTGHIIVSERLKHTLHILSATDGLLVRVVTAGIEIYLPHSLSFDTKGNLWIGCGTYRGEANYAKLHLTHMTFLK